MRNLIPDGCYLDVIALSSFGGAELDGLMSVHTVGDPEIPVTSLRIYFSQSSEMPLFRTLRCDCVATHGCSPPDLYSHS
jgi:hypothetical protein